MMISKKKGGFTLIELLVVIAIIGILSGIVLVSVNSARNKAKDSRVQTNMAQVRTLAETLYDGSAYPSGFVTPTSAGAGCPEVAASDDNLYALAKDTISQIGISTCVAAYGVGDTGQLAINKCTSDSVYGATVRLPSSTLAAPLYWCVDSTGISRGKTAAGVDYNSRAAALTDATDCVCN